MLEAPRTGIFPMTDEEINVPRGSDEGLLGKVFKTHEKHESFARPKPRSKDARTSFCVNHYAGAVQYNVLNVLEKNKDTLPPDLEAVMKKSQNGFVADLFKDKDKPAGSDAGKPAPRARVGGAGGKKKKTLGKQFKEQLATLNETRAPPSRTSSAA